ncbi:hypothetical protein ACFQZE_07410 [Paenibacillus sp. GCM10027627]|uniref:hypothetical protein n=1 Tax=unclassified Paenibacillus TaxID=185978 RepID=UPI0036333161
MCFENQNFEIISGDTKYIEAEIKDKDGNLIDLNGAQIIWEVRSSLKNNNYVIQKTRSEGITLGSKGILTIHLKSIDTLPLSGKYYHLCKITDVAENTSTVFIGFITIKGL